MLTPKEKSKITVNFAMHEKDTGSAHVQVALLTEEIKRLVKHLKGNPKDNHSRRGLLKMVSKRKGLLRFLKDTDENSYQSVIKKLGLRK